MLHTKPSMDVAQDIDQGSREELLQHILASRHFKKSPRLRDFLTYICECSFKNRLDEISEQQIAMQVFGRSAGYNPAEDTIVRSAARQLRQKLELYSLGDGADKAWRLTIPKGSYIPVFESTGGPTEVASPDMDENRPRARIPRRSLIALGVAIASGLVIWGCILGMGAMDPRTVFWRAILAPNHPTLLVSGDSGLSMTMNITRRTVDVREYAETKLKPLPLINPSMPANSPTVHFGDQRYTSVADLVMAMKTTAIAERLSRKLDFRFARDVTLDDLKVGNVILVGDPWGNPWTELFFKQLNFEFRIDAATASHVVINHGPIAQERANYTVYPADPNHKNYALIALTGGLGQQGRALLVEGTSVAGIDMAVDFLFNSERFSDVLKKAVHGSSIDDFEVLLETENVAASASQFKIIGIRLHPQNS
jgi:hypothetical protein